MAKKKITKKSNMIDLRPNMMWFWTVVFIAIMGFATFGQRPSTPLESDWSEGDRLIEQGMVKMIEIVNRDMAQVYL